MTWLVFVLLQLTPFQLTPQSPEMWAYMVDEGQRSITTVYTETSQGLVCNQTSQNEVVKTLETLANKLTKHPAFVAEAMTVYLWNDWTLLYVEGYDTTEVLKAVDNNPQVQLFLEQFYLQHHLCLLGILKVLTRGYEGYYSLQGQAYTLLQIPTGEPYAPVALEPEYFPGTGLLEPLGLVYAVRLGDLLTVGWLREQMITLIAETLRQRSATSQDPLKVRH
jgi:hypothetical protein